MVQWYLHGLTSHWFSRLERSEPQVTDRSYRFFFCRNHHNVYATSRYIGCNMISHMMACSPAMTTSRWTPGFCVPYRIVVDTRDMVSGGRPGGRASSMGNRRGMERPHEGSVSLAPNERPHHFCSSADRVYPLPTFNVNYDDVYPLDVRITQQPGVPPGEETVGGAWPHVYRVQVHSVALSYGCLRLLVGSWRRSWRRG